MSEISLKNLKRAELLEIMVEQGKAMHQMKSELEQLRLEKSQMEAELKERKETIERLKGRLDQKDRDINRHLNEASETVSSLQGIIEKKNNHIKELKTNLEMEQIVHMQPLIKSRSIAEATRHLNRILADAQLASAQYQKMVVMMSKEMAN